MPAAKTKGDDFLLCPRAVLFFAACKRPTVPWPLRYNPAIVDEDARGKIFFEDDLGRVVLAGFGVKAEQLDAVLESACGR